MARPSPAKRVLGVVIVIGSAVLLVKGVGLGVIESQKQSTGIIETIEDVDELVKDSTVGVLRDRDFHMMTFHTEYQIRPHILSHSAAEQDDLQTRYRDSTVLELVEDEALREANVSYLSIRVEPIILERIPIQST